MSAASPGHDHATQLTVTQMSVTQESPVQTTIDAPAGGVGMPLRILHYLPEIRLEHGGVVRAILDWCKVFSERGHQMTLVTCQGDDVPREWMHNTAGITRAVVIPALKPPLRRFGRKAKALFVDLLQRTDVLHLHGPWLPGNVQLAKMARKAGVPYIVSIHGMLDDWSMSQKPWKKKLFMTMSGRRFLHQASRVHCTAVGELTQAQKWFDNKSTPIMPYLMDLSAFEHLPGPDTAIAMLPAPARGSPRLLFLSRLHEKKGVHILIRAAGLMRDAGTPFVLLIAGTGDPIYEGKLNDLVAHLKLRDRVFFLGLVTGIKKISMYQAADIFVLPTMQENFGLVLTEALACGTSVLTTRGTDIWQEVRDAGGEIAEPTAEAFAAAATKLLNDPIDRRQRGEQGRKWVMAELAVEPISRRYEDMYRQMGRGRNAEC